MWKTFAVLPNHRSVAPLFNLLAGDSNSNTKWIIIGAAVGGAAIILLLVLVLLFYLYKARFVELPARALFNVQENSYAYRKIHCFDRMFRSSDSSLTPARDWDVRL